MTTTNKRIGPSQRHDEADLPEYGSPKPGHTESDHGRAEVVCAVEPSDEEESIEEYMAALLDRLRKNETADGAPNTSRRHKPEPNTPAEQQGMGPVVLHEPTNESFVEIVSGQAQLKRRAPIDTANIAAMRELSVAEAEFAINTYRRKRLTRTALGTLSAAISCFFGAALLLSTMPAHHTTLRTVANIGLAVTTVGLFTAGHCIVALVHGTTDEARQDMR